MASRTFSLLLAVGLAVAAVPPQRGVTEQTHELTSSSDLRLVELGVLVDGEEQPVPEALDVRRRETTSVRVLDRFERSAEDPRAVRRLLSIERAGTEIEQELGGRPGPAGPQRLASPLEGRTVVVGPGEGERAWHGEGTAELPIGLLAGVEAPGDFPLLWAGRLEGLVSHLEPEVLGALIQPFGRLGFGLELEDATPADASRWSGEVTLVEVEDAGGSSLEGVLEYVLTFDVVVTRDRTEAQRAVEARRRSSDSFEVLSVVVETSYEGKGRIAWNASKRRLEHVDLTAEVEVEDRTSLKLEGREREQTQRLRGPWTYVYSVQ